MVAISRKLEQLSVRRRYYHGEFRPSPAMIVADVRRRVKKVRGFELVDLAGIESEDEETGRFFEYVLLFQRDGTTLEAQAAIEEEQDDE